jgi:glycine/sarcosine N-methyltransferase
MATLPANNIAYYDQIASSYSLFFRDLERNMVEEGDWLALALPGETRTVLDACCGTGRQAIPLAERGYAVVAADPCSAMLQEATILAQKHGVSPPLVKAGFTELPDRVGGEFDAVIAFGNGLCNLPRRQDILTALGAFRACCRPEGVCLVGIKDFDRILKQRPRFHHRGMQDRDGLRTVLFEIWDYDDPILIVTAFVITGVPGSSATWATKTAQTHEYMLCREELTDLARQAGFTAIERLDHPGEAVYRLSTT